MLFRRTTFTFGRLGSVVLGYKLANAGKLQNFDAFYINVKYSYIEKSLKWAENCESSKTIKLIYCVFSVTSLVNTLEILLFASLFLLWTKSVSFFNNIHFQNYLIIFSYLNIHYSPIWLTLHYPFFNIHSNSLSEKNSWNTYTP